MARTDDMVVSPDGKTVAVWNEQPVPGITGQWISLQPVLLRVWGRWKH